MSGGVSNVGLGHIDIVRDDQWLGCVRKFMDKDYSVSNSNKLLSGAPVWAAYIKNGSGGTLLPGTGVICLSTSMGKTIGAKSGADGRVDGVISPYIRSTGLPNGSYGWVVFAGPAKILAGYGGLAQADVVQTAVDGTFITLIDNNTYAVGRAGIAEEAISAGATGRVWLHFRESVWIPG